MNRFSFVLGASLLAWGVSGCVGVDEPTRFKNQNVTSNVGWSDGLELQHSVVFHEEDRFAGWPANHGLWVWGKEVLVGFDVQQYSSTPNPRHHAKGDTQVVFARSHDLGAHWRVEAHDAVDVGPYVEDAAGEFGGEESFDFDRPHFAFKLRGDFYFTSLSRGRNWAGPFEVPRFGHDQLFGRTNIVASPSEDPLVFMSVLDGEPTQYAKPSSTEQPRASDTVRSLVFAIRDGEPNFEDLNWVAPRPGPNCPNCPVLHNYSLMATAIRLPDRALLAILRERTGTVKTLASYRGTADGRTWSREGVVVSGADNPGSLVHLGGNTVALIYGYRGACTSANPCDIRAKTSVDAGRSWSQEVHLTESALNDDFGYPRATLLKDGRVLVLYYFNTEEQPQPHIRATLWDPERHLGKPIGAQNVPLSTQEMATAVL